MIDTAYMEADLKIATGLVESHFMAGASGGRKSICPGIIGEETTYIFHGPELMMDERSRDLNIEGNPVHEESLEIAKMAGVDFIINVTLSSSFHITGVFAGELEKAHLKAVEKIKSEVEVKVPYSADVVITHGGFVGMNHYQLAKSGVAALPALKDDGYLITIASCRDKKNRIGSANYRTTLALLKLLGPEKFSRLMLSDDWTFLPEEWQVIEWAKVFKKIREEHYYLFAPEINEEDFALLPGRDIRTLSEEDEVDYNMAIELSLSDIAQKEGKRVDELKIIYLENGPYEVPVLGE